MIFDIDDIPEGGLDFDLMIAGDRFKTEQVGCLLNQDVRIQGNFTQFNREIYLKGRVNTGLRLSCSRCLESVDFPVHAELY